MKIKLEDSLVQEIHARYAGGEGVESLSRAYGVPRWRVARIARGKVSKHLQLSNIL